MRNQVGAVLTIRYKPRTQKCGGFPLPAQLAILFSITVIVRTATAHAQNARVPGPNEDWSAHRIDSEIFGFSTDYKEMAAFATDVTRGPAGEHRGLGMLLVFDVGHTTPKENVHVLFITQAANPEAPVPLEPAHERLWAAAEEFPAMWPRRVRKKPKPGDMSIEAVPFFVPVGDGLCTPFVAFALVHQKQRRVQPAKPLKLRASCQALRLSDAQRYWTTPTLGAVGVRFDSGPSEQNEVSVRFPISVSWKTARTYQERAWSSCMADYKDLLTEYAKDPRITSAVQRLALAEHLLERCLYEFGGDLRSDIERFLGTPPLLPRR